MEYCCHLCCKTLRCKRLYHLALRRDITSLSGVGGGNPEGASDAGPASGAVDSGVGVLVDVAACSAASDCKKQAYRAWVAALGTKDPNCIVLKRKYNRASRFFKRQIARAKSKHVVKIGEQLSSY
ncbi:unnamed protein product [Leptidea sinapis]|uniref:Uncharacterized protein n=1 Tax=Leptidea sinapis TaxID=189913 RepID=A0A5E4Q3T4_9NEOP|nr:unnamed protein product [Leptidea sinapis]